MTDFLTTVFVVLLGTLCDLLPATYVIMPEWF